MSPQIKSKERVRDLAEVYTNEREVDAMLDMVADMLPPGKLELVERKFLEPACGNGNFLEAILRRKLRAIRFATIRSQERYEHWILRALASIYAVDIDQSNVTESRWRLEEVVTTYFSMDANTIDPTPGFESAIIAILRTNILRGDTLTQSGTLQVVDYKAVRPGMFLRTWSTLDDSRPMLRRDVHPVPYQALKATPRPTRAAVSALEALSA